MSVFMRRVCHTEPSLYRLLNKLTTPFGVLDLRLEVLHPPLLQLADVPEHAVELPDEVLALLQRRRPGGPFLVMGLCGERWLCRACLARRFRGLLRMSHGRGLRP